MFVHLDRLAREHPGGVPSELINSFEFEGRPMRLIVQPGIRKPVQLSAALTIRTTFTPVGGEAPYQDSVGEDGNLRYKWRGTDPSHTDNQALREAMRRQVPLAYFYPVARGVYQAIYPVFLVDEDPSLHEFAVELVERSDTMGDAELVAERRYARQLTLRPDVPHF